MGDADRDCLRSATESEGGGVRACRAFAEEVEECVQRVCSLPTGWVVGVDVHQPMEGEVRGGGVEEWECDGGATYDVAESVGGVGGVVG